MTGVKLRIDPLLKGLLLIMLFVCCNSRHTGLTDSAVFESLSSNEMPNSITIKALNLSEDMGIVSSKNDEIMVFIYSDSKNLLKGKHTFTATDSIQTFPLQFVPDSNVVYKLVLIEEDSDRSVAQLNEVVKNNLDSLQLFYNLRNYTKIRSVLSDDDILYISDVKNINAQTLIPIQGIHKVDKYHYLISFGIHD
ncbi:MAG: hypothetical protein ACI9JN_001648 [Bacteroidia bacterium]|jgi:hypothetical protein